MTPKVSLVIPCYNVERYLSKCLDSALGQTLSNIEVICVNDGSTDTTLDIIRKYAEADSRVKIIDKPNEGYGKSMNRGFDIATGEYIGILESDDFIDSEMLEVHYNLAHEHDLDVVKSNFYYYWTKPEPRDVFCDLLEEEECGSVVDPFENRHIFFVKPSIWSAIYRRDFIRENDIRFNETPGASYQDASFNFQVWLYARRAWFIRKAYLHYRQDNEASSVNSPGKVYCVCDEYDKMDEILAGYPDKKRAAEVAKILVKMKYDTYMWNYDRLSDELAKEFICRMQSEFASYDSKGQIDWTLFDGFKTKRLKSIIDDPIFFHMTQRSGGVAPNKLKTVGRYVSAGGFPYLAKLVKYKMLK